MRRSVVEKFVLYTTLAMLFGTNFFVWAGGLTIQSFYILVPINLFLMLLLRRLWFPLPLLYTVAALVATCCIGLFQGTDSFPRFAKEAVGIIVTLFYFCSFFRTINFDLASVFRQYTRVAFWVVLYGVVSFPFMAYFYGEPRLRSVLSEPSMFAMTCLPAFYYNIHLFYTTRDRKIGFKVALFLLAFFLAGSSNGFLGLLFGVLVFGRRFKMGLLIALPIVATAAILTYTLSENFELRLNDTFGSLNTEDVRGANLSSFALYTNFFVTQEVLREHPFFGNGLGSHGMSYDRFANNITGVQVFTDTPLERLNADDANSLMLRCLSDFGIVGAGAILFGIWYYRPKGKDDISYMCEGILLYFFLKLLRGGQYFSNEQYFFTLIYFLRPLYTRLYNPLLAPTNATAALNSSFELAPNL